MAEMDMGDLIVPPQLITLLEKVKDFQSVHTPRLNVQRVDGGFIREDEASELPQNIDSFPFSRFVRESFRDPSQWGVLAQPLRHALTRMVTDLDARDAIILNRMILRQMIDKNLRGAEMKLYCDYVANTILHDYHLRDEALTQVASLTWNNYNEDHQSRLWVLMAHLLSCISPSHQLHSYLLKYVSDHGRADYPNHLQQVLLRMPQNQFQTASRLFTPCVLEWQTNTCCAPMAMKIHFADNSALLLQVNSWTTAEEVANRALEHKLGINVQGWSLVLEHENGQVIEVSGHDYIFDLFSYMEAFPELETPPHEFLMYRSRMQSSAFDPSEFLQTENPSRKPSANHVERTQSNRSNPQQRTAQVDSSFSGNFSYGPPNIQMPSNGYGGRTSMHNLHANPSSGRVDSKDISKRIKGGGRMMQPMGGMMMQPQQQMMPMMQSPMMQQPQMMMQPQMMPMQSPMMQPPMMQPPMMQQPMMQQPMMQQPMMQQPMMQPQMQPQMAMPSSIGMMSSAMDLGGQQQSTVQNQMQKWMKMQEEQQKDFQKKLLKEVKKGKADSDSDDDVIPRRRSKKDSRRRHSSDEDRRPSYRSRRDRHSSDEEEPRRRGSGYKGAAAAAAFHAKKQSSSEKPKPQGGSYKFSEPKASPEPQPEKFQRSYRAPKPEKSDDEEDIPEVTSESQGTVRMSFNEKRKFFMAKAKATESQPPARKAPPKKIPLPKSEERETPRHDSDKETGELETPVQRTSWKPPPKVTEEDSHAEALRKIREQKKKNEEQVLLARQRREASRRPEPRRAPSPEPAPKPKPIPAVTKLTAQRMTPIKEPPEKSPTPPRIKTPPSTPSSPSPQSSPRQSAAGTAALAAALAAKQRSQAQQQQEEEEFPQSQPRMEQRAPPLPPPIGDEPTPEPMLALQTDAATRTILHPVKDQPPYAYVNVKWKIRARKEVFHAGEYVKDIEMAKLVFRQVAIEAQKGNPRILPADREDIKQRLNSSGKMELSALKSIIQTCKENWLTYFTQIFRIKVREISPDFPHTLYQANAVGVGQTGVHFITISGGTEWRSDSYDFTKVSQAREQGDGILEILIEGKSVMVHCRKSKDLKRVILPYLVNPPPTKRANVPVQPQHDTESMADQDSMTLEQDEPQEDIYEVLPPPEGSQFSLLIFAQKYFKKPKEAEKTLQYSKTSLTKTLLDIAQPEQITVALQCFKLIQQFMGDIPTKATTDEASLYKLLGLCRKHQSDVLLDEVSIYFAKQLINNKKHSSCARGWRFFSMFVAYFQCSKRLTPHLLSHLHEIVDRDDSINSKGAAVCLVNLQQTITYGGRQVMPSDVEIKALMVGRTSFDQLFFIPGMADAKYKINTSTVVKLAVAHFCNQLGIRNEEDMNEYGVFCVIMNQENQVTDIVPQKRNVYILDILNDMKRKNRGAMLMFQRVVWKNQINYDNERLVQMLFQQIVPEYIDGKFLTFRELSEGLTKAQLGEAAKISALCHRGISGSSLPTQEEVVSYIPRKALEHQTEFAWKEQTQNQFTTVQNLNPHQARSEVLALLTNKKMFGATFFTAEMAGRDGPSMKMLAIDAKNLYISDPENHFIEAEYPLSHIVEVQNRINDETKLPMCDISIQTGSGVMPLSLKTRKAAVIAGILNHHIAIVVKS